MRRDEAEREGSAETPPTELTSPGGRPLHPVIAAVAIGAWFCSFGFDLVSRVADTAWVYERGAYVLTAIGVVVGVVAATVGFADLVQIPRETRAFHVGVRHLVCMDSCLVLFTASLMIRRSSDFEWHAGVGVVPMGLSIAGLMVLGAGVRLGSRLTYTHGVRVASHPDR